MKVNESINKPSGLVEAAGKEGKKMSETNAASFQNKLRNVESRSFEERVQTMVNNINEQGEKLGKRADIRELKVYKQMISEFLDEAVGNSHKFSKQSFLDRRGRHRVYATIKKINEGLDKLTSEVLNKEKDNIKILQSIDDIRGLILDMTM